jgi:hypothetical protein
MTMRWRVGALAARAARHSVRLGAAALVLGMATPATAQAQNGGRQVTAFRLQNLGFGTLFVGVPSYVSPADPLHAGQLEVRGEKGAEVRIDLTLPRSMTGPGGASLALEFAASDGRYARDLQSGAWLAFDPRVPLVTRTSSNGKLYVALGGTARPTNRQSAGSYSGTVNVTVSYTGN